MKIFIRPVAFIIFWASLTSGFWLCLWYASDCTRLAWKVLHLCINWNQLMFKLRPVVGERVTLMGRNMTANMTVSGVNMLLATCSKWLELNPNAASKRIKHSRRGSSSVCHLLKPALRTVPPPLFHLQHVHLLILLRWKWPHAARVCDYTLVFIDPPH